MRRSLRQPDPQLLRLPVPRFSSWSIRREKVEGNGLRRLAAVMASLAAEAAALYSTTAPASAAYQGYQLFKLT